MVNKINYDVIVIGAGAAGMMCAITAGAKGQQVLIIDHSEKIGEKIFHDPPKTKYTIYTWVYEW